MKTPEEFLVYRMGACRKVLNNQWCLSHDFYYPAHTEACDRFTDALDLLEQFAEQQDEPKDLGQQSIEAFAYSRQPCVICDHRRKDHDGPGGMCARYDDLDCKCGKFVALTDLHPNTNIRGN